MSMCSCSGRLEIILPLKKLGDFKKYINNKNAVPFCGLTFKESYLSSYYTICMIVVNFRCDGSVYNNCIKKQEEGRPTLEDMIKQYDIKFFYLLSEPAIEYYEESLFEERIMYEESRENKDKIDIKYESRPVWLDIYDYNDYHLPENIEDEIHRGYN